MKAIFLVSLLFGITYAMKISAKNDVFDSKTYISSCNLFVCEDSMKKCVTEGCNGEFLCQKCVSNYTPLCQQCVKDIIDEAMFDVSNRKTISCDAGIQLQRTACAFFCRMKFRPSSVCRSVYQPDFNEAVAVCDCWF
jgi:hypothetical protein